MAWGDNMNPNLIFLVFAVLFFAFIIMFLVSYIRTTKEAKKEKEAIQSNKETATQQN